MSVMSDGALAAGYDSKNTAQPIPNHAADWPQQVGGSVGMTVHHRQYLGHVELWIWGGGEKTEDALLGSS